MDFSHVLSDGVTVNFYAPVYSKKKITGIIVGVIEQNTLKKMLASASFGVATETYLTTSKGKIVSCFNGKDTEIGQYL